MGIARISRNETGSSYTIQVDAGNDGSLVVLSNEGGAFLSRIDEAGNEAVLAPTTTLAQFQYGYVETLSDGRYALYTTWHFGQGTGSRVQILNADGSAATEVINPMFEDGEDRNGAGYTLTATHNGGFAFVWNDISRASESFQGTHPPYNGNSTLNSNAGYDVRVRFFDGNAVGTGPSTVADDDVETINGATISRRALDQYINDSATLAGGQTAFVFMDNRWVGNPDYGTNQDWQLSLQIAVPGNVGEPIKVDVRPFDNDKIGEVPDSLEPGVSAPNVIALPDGTLAVIWTEKTYVADPGVWGGYAYSGTQALIRYFNAAGEALTDAIPIVTRGTAHGNHSTYVWAEALPDGRIAIAYNGGVYGVSGNGTLNAYVGVIGPLGSSVEVTRINAAAQNGQFYTIQDMAVRTDGTIDLAYNDASVGSNGFNRNFTVIDRLAFTGPGEPTAIGNSANNNLVGGGAGETMFAQAGNDSASGNGGADRIHGGSGDDRLEGGSGGDRLWGDDGNDVLDGGTGTDRMEGGTGNDSYYVDSPLDQVIEAADSGIDTVRSSISFTLAADFERLALLGSAATGTGNALANGLTGSDSDNLLDGVGGNDTINGKGGNDTLKGGSGADKLDGGFSHDSLFGGDGNDGLVGGTGNDKLYGDLGNDSLTGGSGLDRFHFDSALNRTANVDKILDFSVADDGIFLSRSIFGAIAANGTLASGAFHKGTGAADTADRIVYDQSTGRIFYDADGSGGGAQILFATVAANTPLTNADFIVYG